MLWFKKKVRVEDHVGALIKDKLPQAAGFFDKENKHAHYKLEIERSTLIAVGAGMTLFFLGKFLPDTEAANLKIMSRAYKEVERRLPALNANPKDAYTWWKAYTDGLIFQEDQPRLKIACRLTWEKLLPDKSYREASPLRTFAYFLEMEVEGAQKVHLV